jgi:hypothetical protein
MTMRRTANLQNRLAQETVTRLNESSGKGHALDRSVVDRHGLWNLGTTHVYQSETLAISTGRL